MIKFFAALLALCLGTGVALAASLYPEDHGNYENQLQQAKEKHLPVVMHFYADWCTDCRNMLPAMNEVEKEYQGKVVFVHLNVDRGETHSLAQHYQVTYIPTLIFLDSSQSLQTKMVGPVNPSSLEEEMKKLFPLKNNL